MWRREHGIRAAPALCFALAVTVRLAMLPARPIPEPAVHDEFAYLLGAETFCLGRLTNPPHPMWVHFETFHENFQPTYQSKYPPGQSLFLALGWTLFGHPWYGVLLSCGLMCAALCWMLQGWLPPRYALLGGLMAAAQWGIAGYWINSYMGGAVAAGAGALVVGAVPRLARRSTAGVAGVAGWAALGLAGLSITRPYEGAMTALAAAAGLCIWRWRVRRPFGELPAWRLAWPAAAILGCGAAWLLYYNYRVTGHALLMPYALHQARYGASPIFWPMPAGSVPVYHHETIRRLWAWDKSYYDAARANPLSLLTAFLNMLRYFLNPVSAMALFAGLFLRGGRKVRMAAGMAAVAAGALLLERYSLPHYFAPAMGLVLVLAMLGVQYIGVKFGRRGVAVFAALFFANAAYDRSRLTADEYPHKLFTAHRLNVIHRLAEEMPVGSSHLVIARYAPDHNVLEEWVYNRADIDGSAIVWARDMGNAANRELIAYYAARQPARKVWRMDADVPDPAPAPYDPR